MGIQYQNQLDGIDLQILRELQTDARLSFSEIGRRVNLSQPTVAERIRRMEESGVIRGYHVDVDPAKIGQPITAFVRLRIINPIDFKTRVTRFIESETEYGNITECHWVTGDDCLLIKLHLSSIPMLSEFLHRLSGYGASHTSIAHGTLIERRYGVDLSADLTQQIGRNTQ